MPLPTNGTLAKIAIGVIGTLAAAGILGAIANAQTTAVNREKCERNQAEIRELKRDLTHRLDTIEMTQREILRELRK